MISVPKPTIGEYISKEKIWHLQRVLDTIVINRILYAKSIAETRFCTIKDWYRYFYHRLLVSVLWPNWSWQSIRRRWRILDKVVIYHIQKCTLTRAGPDNGDSIRFLKPGKECDFDAIAQQIWIPAENMMRTKDVWCHLHLNSVLHAFGVPCRAHPNHSWFPQTGLRLWIRW